MICVVRTNGPVRPADADVRTDARLLRKGKFVRHRATCKSLVRKFTPIETYTARPKVFPTGYQIPPHATSGAITRLVFAVCALV